MKDLGEHPQTTTLSDRVYRIVRESIRSGVYRPGEKITHRAVASQLGVSVTPVREAVTRLVSEESLSMAGPKTIVAPSLGRSDLEEITKIRVNLEGWAAELAAENASATFIRELEQHHLAYCRHRRSHDIRQKIAANAKFHFALYAQSKAPRLLAIIDNLWVTMGPTLGLLAYWGEDNDGERFQDAAIAALKARNTAAAQAAIVNYIRTGRLKILQILERE
ncbi:GntR family transcriptional regulator [Mesorhizobium sp. M1E.F.Ca.ET.041.01.1.1]|uniref:GntR family transcriptional regulator n=1 Tax=Mesorhizobium sp. M1E.F.Ca.ET.041.01.1.1 TaxID=2496759 RepID=UPI000FCA6944|nr:GntR family transcriptional regulator [Mesorhizobium sp. M1E.F.Ca.ET.041.01.1.1]RUW26972.1 GntR family transcriptional regulator [Mesorhizobium sp. M1E.F.Ca.ET.041.01.1.1]RWD87088.1 MAG: GntR family transcriptional regulator [Mesorhizobium sp.]